ncbi:uncharacterized protein MONBRDRAFT_22789 [Monosiga brevicollis MX1]|uniref:Putative glycoside hydrolase 22789 n=1 Tax=Monosiga brevicollis TaxID=81824 RepID=GHL3_MONBE|nr:uncharacterized protein MONBRDRAFT_22789 [Monosiga brevicollis MX1]A9US33.1 RecName: Full=Putative glycoside hydrolase 22789 [Monosiga brevicollis]EDQ92033.1 predicted protein [Monosiga brevicollis MX1]|eukprot:XP_001743319.1 hypothetical protein [Monosiga brevicollis MX1]
MDPNNAAASSAHDLSSLDLSCLNEAERIVINSFMRGPHAHFEHLGVGPNVKWDENLSKRAFYHLVAINHATLKLLVAQARLCSMQQMNAPNLTNGASATALGSLHPFSLGNPATSVTMASNPLANGPGLRTQLMAPDFALALLGNGTTPHASAGLGALNPGLYNPSASILGGPSSSGASSVLPSPSAHTPDAATDANHLPNPDPASGRQELTRAGRPARKKMKATALDAALRTEMPNWPSVQDDFVRWTRLAWFEAGFASTISDGAIGVQTRRPFSPFLTTTFAQVGVHLPSMSPNLLRAFNSWVDMHLRSLRDHFKGRIDKPHAGKASLAARSLEDTTFVSLTEFINNMCNSYNLINSELSVAAVRALCKLYLNVRNMATAKDSEGVLRVHIRDASNRQPPNILRGTLPQDREDDDLLTLITECGAIDFDLPTDTSDTMALAVLMVMSTSATTLTLDQAGCFSSLSGAASAQVNLLTNVTCEWFSVTMVTESGTSTISLPSSTRPSAHISAHGKDFALSWPKITEGLEIDIGLTLELQHNVTLDAYELRAKVVNHRPKAKASLWQLELNLRNVRQPEDGSAFFPAGYGVRYQGAFAASGSYPSSGATMQWMAAGGGAANEGQGLYLAAHDGYGYIKFLNAAAVEDVASLSIVYLVEDAGLPFAESTMPFPLTLAVVGGGDDLWYQAAQMYRTFALGEAQWMQAGRLHQRQDIPGWYVNNSIWINSGWQCHDIFNETQGDPHTVLNVTRRIRERFNTNMALHWYEWQQGPDANASARYRFDTHYPDYLPPRGGDYFGTVVRELEKEGVHIFPYINGRIFDVASTSYAQHNGSDHCCRKANPSFGAADQSFYVESYGSGSTFHTADPTDIYWQTTLADTVDALVNTYGVEGVYIDQLAAAAPTPDWTSWHNHTKGGGFYWRTGIVDIIKAMRQRVGPTVPLVTESNSEPYMDAISGFLTLVAFEPAFVGTKALVPAFPAIYGGYFVGFGDIFNAEDLADQDPLMARVVAQFVYGAQLGWFSLGGVTSGPDVDTSCGKMGEYDLWMSESSDAIVAAVEYYGNLRVCLLEYLAHGRILAPPSLSPAPAEFMAVETAVQNAGPFPSAMSAVWLHEDEASAVIIVAGVLDAGQTYNVSVDLTFSLPSLHDRQVTVQEMSCDGLSQQLDVMPANDIQIYDVTLSDRNARVYRVHFGA